MNKTHLNQTLTFVSILNIHIQIGLTIKTNLCQSSKLVSMNKTHLNQKLTFVLIFNIHILSLSILTKVLNELNLCHFFGLER